MRILIALLVAIVVSGALPALAAKQIVLGKSFVVKDPKPGVDPSHRSIVVLGQEAASDNTVVGDPVNRGAMVLIVADGNDSVGQTFNLPQPGWKAVGSPVIGYIYKDALGANGPVEAAEIKRAANGTFLVKVSLKGGIGTGAQPHIRVVPPAPGTDGGMMLSLGVGDSYCVNFGGAAGGAVTNTPTGGTPNKVFKIAGKRNAPTTEAGCPICFQDFGDGTIHDICTGLQWEKKDANPDVHDVSKKYSWAGCCNGVCSNTSATNYCQPNAAAEATCLAHSDGGTQGCSTCPFSACNVDPYGLGAVTTIWDWVNQVNAVNFAGHSDWRLPLQESGGGGPFDELSSIEDGSFGIPSIDPIFGPTASSFYWSASTYPGAPYLANDVFFGGGGAGSVTKGIAEAVRAVR